ncbi:MAG: hypothetical protein KUG75_09030 [Pseudomonadales bacterium]|nr:hypothetical protein [Pseudomonadales bacterium]
MTDKLSIFQRAAGLIILCTVFLFLDPLQSNLLHRLILPLTAMLGTILILRSIVAIALSTLLLTFLASNISGDIYQAWVYPSSAFFSMLILAVVYIRRFQTNIRATHEKRWESRRGTQRSSND